MASGLSGRTAEQTRLYEILDTDPAAAIAAARQLQSREDLDQRNIECIRAAVFIEAGGLLNDAAVIVEGIEIFRRPAYAKKPDFAYNLANGLAALVRVQRAGQPAGLDAATERQEIRILFRRAADESDNPSIQSQSLTTLANQLKDSRRWIEAYDTYAAAIDTDPANAVALSGIASLLRWRLRKHVDDDGPIRRAAVRYLLRARAQISTAQKYAGPLGVNRVEELLRDFNLDEAAVSAEEPPAVSGYADFVRRHRLALCRIISFVEKSDRAHPWTPIVAL
jgi:tetratricopeptide (TPR) repeat protein